MSEKDYARLFASRGGKARAQKLEPERIVAIALKASQAARVARAKLSVERRRELAMIANRARWKGHVKKSDR